MNDSLKNFVASMMYGEELEPMTIEEAAYTIEQWKAEGLEIPECVTPESYSDEWNRQLEPTKEKEETTVKIMVPVDVEITRFYRVYIESTDEESFDSIRQRVRAEIIAKQDSVLTPDPDLEIEEQDIRCVSIDYDGIQLD